MSDTPGALRPEIAIEGEGTPVLVLHGGGGPATVTGLSKALSANHRVLTPTHPGWNGLPRPSSITRMADLARLYLAELAADGLQEVTVIGSSVGGWIAAEMAALDTRGVVGRLILIDAMGITVPGEDLPNFFGLTPRQIADYSYHDPDRFFVDPATLPPERIAMQRANIATLNTLAGEPYMHDPELPGRLADIRVPTLLLWGESDRIATPAYGRAFAEMIPGAEFRLIERAGHLPQLERPTETLAAIESFISR